MRPSLVLAMRRFSEGDRVRIDIPNEEDSDHEEYHEKHRWIVSLLVDDAGAVTGDE